MPDQLNQTFVICDIRALWRSGCQKLQITA